MRISDWSSDVCSSDLKGSCLCGRIAFEIDGKIGPIGQCHCSKCRKLSGTDGNAVFYTAVQSFRWLSGENVVGSFPVPCCVGWPSSFCRTFCSPPPLSTLDPNIYFFPFICFSSFLFFFFLFFFFSFFSFS